MNATTTVAPCSRCDGPAEHATYSHSSIEGRPIVFFAAEQMMNKAPVCARCFLESEDR